MTVCSPSPTAWIQNCFRNISLDASPGSYIRPEIVTVLRRGHSCLALCSTMYNHVVCSRSGAEESNRMNGAVSTTTATPC